MTPPTDKPFYLSSEEFSTLINTRIFGTSPDPIGYPTPNQYPTLSAEALTFDCPFCKFKNGSLTYQHILVCPGGGGNIKRHNECIYLFQQLLTIAGIPHTIREPKNINTSTRKRVDIITSHINAQRGYDLAIVSPNVPTYCHRASKEQFYAAQSKFNEKITKHQPAYTAENADFIPLILESTGAIHPRTLSEIGALISLAGQTPHPTHHAFNIQDNYQYWTHTISIAAVRATINKQIIARSKAHNLVQQLLMPPEGTANLPTSHAPHTTFMQTLRPSFSK